jgi:Fur family ferric uptake transcriptional regulator
MEISAPDSQKVSEDLLRAAGVKVTQGRVRVLTVLRSARRPLCHGDIETQLAADASGALDRVTLYRILDSLVACGLARKAADGQGVFRFAAAGPAQAHEGHLHFRCLDCGGLFCLDAPPPPPPRLPAGFRMAAMDMDLRGVCARCLRPKEDAA